MSAFTQENAGMPTFPRPHNVPNDYVVRITEKSAGMEYINPSNTHVRIRIMPGKLHSPNQHQQKPYVTQRRDGKAFDKILI